MTWCCNTYLLEHCVKSRDAARWLKDIFTCDQLRIQSSRGWVLSRTLLRILCAAFHLTCFTTCSALFFQPPPAIIIVAFSWRIPRPSLLLVDLYSFFNEFVSFHCPWKHTKFIPAAVRSCFEIVFLPKQNKKLNFVSTETRLIKKRTYYLIHGFTKKKKFQLVFLYNKRNNTF